MAVTVALWSLLMAPVVALKVAVVAAAATVTEAGTVRTALLLVRVTRAPPVGAGFDSVTVQVLEELGPRLVGLHEIDDISTGAVRLTVVFTEVLF